MNDEEPKIKNLSFLNDRSDEPKYGWTILFYRLTVNKSDVCFMSKRLTYYVSFSSHDRTDQFENIIVLTDVSTSDGILQGDCSRPLNGCF